MRMARSGARFRVPATVFDWCEQQHAESIRDAMVAGSHPAPASDPGSRTLVRPARAFWNDQNRLTLGPSTCITSAPATPIIP